MEHVEGGWKLTGRRALAFVVGRIPLVTFLAVSFLGVDATSDWRCLSRRD
jgi:hypothetical protein